MAGGSGRTADACDEHAGLADWVLGTASAGASAPGPGRYLAAGDPAGGLGWLIC